MSKSKGLIKVHTGTAVNTLTWLMISNILKSVSQWGILVILVKFFSTEEVGYFTLGMAIAAPIFMLSEMQMKSVLVVEPEDGKDFFHTYLAIRIISASIALIGLMTYCILFREINWIILAVIIYKSAESLIDIQYGYYQKKDKMIWMSKIDIFKTLLTVLTCFIVAFALHQIGLTLLSIIAVSFFLYVINTFYIRQRLVKELEPISFSVAKDIIKKSLPLGISVFLVSYVTNYPRISIEGQMGSEMLAFFGAYSYLVVGVFQISAPIQTYLRQRLSMCYQNNDYKGFSLKVLYAVSCFCIIGFLFLLGFFLGGEEIVRILYNDSYVDYSGVVFYLVIAQLLSTIAGVFSTAVLSFNIYTKQAIISFGVLVVVVVCTKPLISNYGLYGGAYVNIIASAVIFLAYFSLYFKRMRRWRIKV